jgi:hypothetical protein
MGYNMGLSVSMFVGLADEQPDSDGGRVAQSLEVAEEADQNDDGEWNSEQE